MVIFGTPTGTPMKLNLPVTGHEIRLSPEDVLISRTDTRGIITFANEGFVRVSGFTEAELVGQSHNVVPGHQRDRGGGRPGDRGRHLAPGRHQPAGHRPPGREPQPRRRRGRGQCPGGARTGGRDPGQPDPGGLGPGPEPRCGTVPGLTPQGRPTGCPFESSRVTTVSPLVRVRARNRLPPGPDWATPTTVRMSSLASTTCCAASRAWGPAMIW